MDLTQVGEQEFLLGWRYCSCRIRLEHRLERGIDVLHGLFSETVGDSLFEDLVGLWQVVAQSQPLIPAQSSLSGGPLLDALPVAARGTCP